VAIYNILDSSVTVQTRIVTFWLESLDVTIVTRRDRVAQIMMGYVKPWLIPLETFRQDNYSCFTILQQFCQCTSESRQSRSPLLLELDPLVNFRRPLAGPRALGDLRLMARVLTLGVETAVLTF